MQTLEKYLTFCKEFEKPILLHVITKKGKGYSAAISDPERFHGTGAFDIETAQSHPKKIGTPPSYQDVFGETIAEFAKKDPKIVGITAAMSTGTSLNKLEKACPKQFFDVGIAEEHAVLFAAGLATKGFKPVCAIYSTFLQRAIDPIIHDVCLQNLPVLFCMDRAGLSPNDGPTHHGLFDLSYLRMIPNVVLMQPKDEDELVDMMHTGLICNQPTFIRYPRGAACGKIIKEEPIELKIGKAQVLKKGTDIHIWALGAMVSDAIKLAEYLEDEHELSVAVVNARFVKPLDVESLKESAICSKMIVTMEDNVLQGGFGSAVLESLNEMRASVAVERIGWPDSFVGHGSSVDALRLEHGLDSESIRSKVLKHWDSLGVNPSDSVRITTMKFLGKNLTPKSNL